MRVGRLECHLGVVDWVCEGGGSSLIAWGVSGWEMGPWDASLAGNWALPGAHRCLRPSTSHISYFRLPICCSKWDNIICFFFSFLLYSQITEFFFIKFQVVLFSNFNNDDNYDKILYHQPCNLQIPENVTAIERIAVIHNNKWIINYFFIILPLLLIIPKFI